MRCYRKGAITPAPNYIIWIYNLQLISSIYKISHLWYFPVVTWSWLMQWSSSGMEPFTRKPLSLFPHNTPGHRIEKTARSSWSDPHSPGSISVNETGQEVKVRKEEFRCCDVWNNIPAPKSLGPNHTSYTEWTLLSWNNCLSYRDQSKKERWDKSKNKKGRKRKFINYLVLAKRYERWKELFA